MQALQFFKTVTADKSNLLDRLLKLLADTGVRYCVIGDVAVSAYAEPLLGLDFDIVVATPRILAITSPNSDLRVNVYTEARYGDFVDSAVLRTVFGMELPIASLENVFRAKLWALDDTARSGTKHQKDLLDTARLILANPKLRKQVPPKILQRIAGLVIGVPIGMRLYWKTGHW
jgi:hypothetical protein